MLLIAIQLQNDDPRLIPSPDWAPDFPAVRLAEVQALDGVAPARGEYGRQWTPSGAVVDWFAEEGAADGMDVQLKTTCYRLPLPWGAAYALEQYRCMYDELGRAYGRVDTDLADEAWAAAPCDGNQNQMELLVRKGRYLVTVSFGIRWPSDYFLEAKKAGALYSEQSLELLLPLLAERLNAAQR